MTEGRYAALCNLSIKHHTKQVNIVPHTHDYLPMTQSEENRGVCTK